MITIEFSESAKAIIEELKKMPELLEEALRTSVDQGSLMIQNKAKELAPYITGNLKRSITRASLSNDRGLSQSIGSSVVYAAIKEYGGMAGRNRSVHIKAKPYLNPAAEQSESAIMDIFERNIQNAIK